jgi:hypothetical protein
MVGKGSSLPLPGRLNFTARDIMDIREGFTDAIGNTPLIKLRKASELTGCTILGKAEFMNPGGSVKDRAALAIIEDAERQGKLRPGGVIVEGTAGNTGIGLALVADARGYRTIIVIPETQSQEKKDMIRLAGAELREVPPRKSTRASPTARSGPTSSTMPPTATGTTAPPARRFGIRPTARSTGSSARSVAAARWAASPWP